MCFAAGVLKDDELDELMTSICGNINKTLREAPEYENNLICVGGALSTEVGRDFGKLLVAADRALFYIKELEKKGCYLYKKEASVFGEYSTGNRLEQMIGMMVSDKAKIAEYEADYPGVAKIYELVRNIYKEKKREIQIVLITVTPTLGITPAVSDRDEAMGYLQNAINITKDETILTFRFSSVQYLVIITEPAKDNTDSVIDRLLNCFYKAYDKKNMAHMTEAASLPDIRG